MSRRKSLQRPLALLLLCLLLFAPLTIVHAASPVATSFSTALPVSVPSVIQLQGSDPDGTPLTFATTINPAHGALSQLDASRGTIIYTPTAGYTGTDNFQFTVTSGGETSTAGTVSLTVTDAKTRVIDTIATGSGLITFILTQAATSPGGIYPANATVTSVVDSTGHFDVSLYPSRAVSPVQFYQVWFTDSANNQRRLGLADIPAATTPITLSPYFVTDTNLAAKFTFASAAAVSALTSNYYNHVGIGTDVPAANKVFIGTGANTSGWSDAVPTAAIYPALLDAGLVPYNETTVPGMYAFFDARRITGVGDNTNMQKLVDLTGQGHDAVQNTSSLRLTYHNSEFETGLPYVSSADGTKYATMPLPATSTWTILAVARLQAIYPYGSLFKFSDDALLTTFTPSIGFFWYRQAGGFGTPQGGYGSEWSVVGLRRNADNSGSLFVDGQLVSTFTPQVPWSTFTSVQIGPGAGRILQIPVFDRALTDSEMVRQAIWLRKYDKLTWQFEYPTTLASSALIVRKEGLVGNRPLVLLNHPAGYDERYFIDSPTFHPVVSALVEAGYIVASSRLGSSPTTGYDTWGNQVSLDANAELYTYLTAHYPIDTSRVAMVGASMGGLASLLSVPDGRIPVKGIALYSPVASLAHAYSDNFGLFQTSINTAYGITGTPPHDYATATAGHDPYLLPAATFANVRVRTYGGPGDTVLVWSNQGLALATRLNGVALESGVVTLSGDHLANADTTVSDLMDFMKRSLN